MSGQLIGSEVLEDTKTLIDELIDNKVMYKRTLRLILPAIGDASIVEVYKGFPIRKWTDLKTGKTRYDTAYEY